MICRFFQGFLIVYVLQWFSFFINFVIRKFSDELAKVVTSHKGREREEKANLVF